MELRWINDYDSEWVEELLNDAEKYKDMYHWIKFAKAFVYAISQANPYIDAEEMEDTLLHLKRQHYKMTLSIYTVFNMAARFDNEGNFTHIMLPATGDTLSCIKFYKKAFKNNINFTARYEKA